MALHPAFKENQLIYFCYTTKTDDIEVRLVKTMQTGMGFFSSVVCVGKP